MSKRKYSRNVSRIVYGWNQDSELGDDTAHYKIAGINGIPCRIVRESFYRKLIQCYEQWGDRRAEQ